MSHPNITQAGGSGPRDRGLSRVTLACRLARSRSFTCPCFLSFLLRGSRAVSEEGTAQFAPREWLCDSPAHVRG